MKLLAAVISIFFLTVGSASAEDRNTLVANGDVPVSMKEWPYAVALSDSLGAYCTGTLIRPNWVLTAGHCLEGGLPNKTIVTTGPGSSSPSLKLVPSSFIVHPRYVGEVRRCFLGFCWDQTALRSTRNDIGLIELKNSAPASSIANLAGSGAEKYFPDYRRNINSGTPLTVQIGGYGRPCESDKCSTGLFRQGSVTLIGSKECGEKMDQISERGMICARNGSSKTRAPQNTCSGDSGGPLVLRRYKGDKPVSGKGLVIGVTSMGSCGVTPYSAFFHVRPYLPWINTTIAKSNAAI